MVKKSIIKDKLINEIQYNYARTECIVQSQMKHENIVELYDYTENEKEFVLLLEYVNDAKYFEEKIEEVSNTFEKRITLLTILMLIISEKSSEFCITS